MRICAYANIRTAIRNISTIVASKPHNKEVVGQLDYLFPESGNDPSHTISDTEMKSMYCLQIGESSMLLLMRDVVEDLEVSCFDSYFGSNVPESRQGLGKLPSSRDCTSATLSGGDACKFII